MYVLYIRVRVTSVFIHLFIVFNMVSQRVKLAIKLFQVFTLLIYMYICMQVYINIYLLSIHKHMINKLYMHIYMYVCACVCVCAFTAVCHFFLSFRNKFANICNCHNTYNFIYVLHSMYVCERLLAILKQKQKQTKFGRA